MDNATIDQLAKIEAALAHLEHQYDQLNKVVVEQGRSLAKLQALQHQISQALDGIELDRVRSTNSKPPHYQ